MIRSLAMTLVVATLMVGSGGVALAQMPTTLVVESQQPNSLPGQSVSFKVYMTSSSQPSDGTGSITLTATGPAPSGTSVCSQTVPWDRPETFVACTFTSPGTYSITATYSDPSNTYDPSVATTEQVVIGDVCAPSLQVSSPTLPEGNTGTTTFAFIVVTMTGPDCDPVPFTYATAATIVVLPGMATPGSDYTAVSGSGTVSPTAPYIINVPVLGDSVVEPNETFQVVVNWSGGMSGGTGTILNDDAAAPTLPTTGDHCKKGGWMAYDGLFKNQGDCVSFVATNGRNPGNGPTSANPRPDR